MKPVDGSNGLRLAYVCKQMGTYEERFMALVVVTDDHEAFPVGFMYTATPMLWEVDRAWPASR